MLLSVNNPGAFCLTDFIDIVRYHLYFSVAIATREWLLPNENTNSC